MKSIFEYTDYRSYLKDFIGQKRKSRYMSNRWFAEKIGINSSSWLTSILQGKKGLSKVTANKISKLLGHAKSETQFFENLVFFNQAKNIEQRGHYYKEMQLVSKSKKLKEVKHTQHEYYDKWYHSVIRAIINMINFKDDYKLLAKMLSPQITPKQAQDSIDLLEQHGFIKKDKDGYYKISEPLITTGDDLQKLAIANFQKETMMLAWEAVDRFPKEMRDISTLTMGISKKGLDEIKKEILDFRKRVIEIASEDDPEDRVCQLNIALYPLSEAAENGKNDKNKK